MKHPRPGSNEQGVALWTFVALVTVVAAATAAVGMLCVVESRAASETDRRMRSFYLADSGAQIANAILTTTAGLPPETNFEESLAGGNVSVAIAQNGTQYEVTSTGTYQGSQETLIMNVEFTALFDMEGAVQVNFGTGMEVSAGSIPFRLRAATHVSGMDHAPDGTLLADQSNATYGLAMAPVPGNVNVDVFVDVSNGASLEGAPEQTSNEAEGNMEVFNQLVGYSRNNADIFVTGNTTLNNPDDGLYGTPGAPQLTFVELDDGETLHMRQNFHGYGTLVISVGDTTSGPALIMEDSSEWHGLVVVEFRGQAEVPGGALIELRNYAKIMGGLSVNFTGDEVPIDGTGDVVDLSAGFAEILYSSALANSAAGIPQVVDYSSEVIAYRRQ